MTPSRSLWATLHDGVLERAHIDEGAATFVIDVPHVRGHAKLAAEARFCVRATSEPWVTALRWVDPSASRPAASDEDANAVWRALGSMRSVEWDAFANVLAAPESRFDVVEASLSSSDGRAMLTLGGSLLSRSQNRLEVEGWYVLRIEAGAITFAHAHGEDIALDAFDAMGRAYWAAFAKKPPR